MELRIPKTACLISSPIWETSIEDNFEEVNFKPVSLGSNLQRGLKGILVMTSCAMVCFLPRAARLCSGLFQETFSASALLSHQVKHLLSLAMGILKKQKALSL